jgi:hypothetical protein
MTLPAERARSLNTVREFLRDLLDPKKTPKVPSIIRQQAYWCLRHYPAEYDIEEVCKALPDRFALPKEKRKRGKS